MSSIRQRLLITLLTLIAIAGGITLQRSYQDARHEVQELFDAQLAQSGRVLQSLVYHEALEGEHSSVQGLLHGTVYSSSTAPLDYTSHGHNYELTVSFQVWDEQRRLLLHSSSVSEQPLDTEAFSEKTPRFTDTHIGKARWRVFSVWDRDHRFLVQVGERYDIRDELSGKISRRLITPYLISLPILGLLIWFGIGRGLSPLRRVAAEVQQRDTTHLSPLDSGSVPDEVRPLVISLNDLFARLQRAFDRERRFTADAAHELRTPLSALKTQAQVALRAEDTEQRRQALHQVINGVDRATHLIEQLLALARLEPGLDTQARSPVMLHALAAEVMSTLASRALDHKLDIALSGDEQVTVTGEPGMLSMLLRNLIDNAIRYTQPGGHIEVNIARRGAAVVLSVTDTGPGIAPELRERVLDPFYRVLGQAEPGCGLGLAIVRQIAELHGARLSLADNPHGSGLRVEVRFPS